MMSVVTRSESFIDRFLLKGGLSGSDQLHAPRPMLRRFSLEALVEKLRIFQH